jgi:hypothetical protein
MSKRKVNLQFPLGGVNRAGRYAQQHKPYTTPYAINVRSVGPLEKRGRGGSRPGLKRYVSSDFGTTIAGMCQLTYIDSGGVRRQDLAVIVDGTFKILRSGVVSTTQATLQTPEGTDLLAEDGSQIILASTIGTGTAFHLSEYNGKLYIADSVLRVYDPNTGEVVPVIKSAGIVPTAQPLVTIFQERVVLAGADHIYYMSAQANPTNWDFGADMGNKGRAYAGQIGRGGSIAETTKSLLNYRDKALVLGSEDALHVVYGNMAAGGESKCISPSCGIIAPWARCATPDGRLLFLSRNGLNMWQIGSDQHPEPFSQRVVPESLLDIDVTAVTPLMYYDHRSRGIHLFLTPSTGIGTHWWIDLENKALWPVELQMDHQPLAMARVGVGDYSDVILGCKDGYLRRFDDDSDDDGYEVESTLLIGPLHVSGDSMSDGVIKELQGVLAQQSDDVDWQLIVGETAEQAVDLAEEVIETGTEDGIAASGLWRAGRNRTDRPKRRGPWAMLLLTSMGSWSYEEISLIVAELGRIRTI